MSSTPKLFQPIKVGSVTLKHRVVLAPLTRFRANAAHVHGDLAVEYYAQRASTPGTLLISEATFISQAAGGWAHVPGVWNDEQVAAWKRVTDAVHEKGSFIYCQLWALGRTADMKQLSSEDPSFPYISASDIPLKSKPTERPRPLTIEEIREYVQTYATAASNAVRAGFDGVEIHGAHGFLVDQFLQDVSNNRVDEYGGSIENRARFGLEVIAAIAKAIGPEKTAIRLSPWATVHDMGMADPIPTFSYFVKRVKELYPDLAYVHVVEPRVSGGEDVAANAGESNDFIRDIWSPLPLISAGGYTPELALKAAEEKGDLIAFGRAFIANPDLPVRILKKIPLAAGVRDTYYLPEDPKGYVDYPFASTETQ